MLIFLYFVRPTVRSVVSLLTKQLWSGLDDENEKNKDMRSKLHFYKMEYETLNNNLKRDLQFNVLDCVKPSGIPRMGKES